MYVTIQITFLTRKLRNVERNLHCDVVHIITVWVASLTLDCNGVFAIKTIVDNRIAYMHFSVQVMLYAHTQFNAPICDSLFTIILLLFAANTYIQSTGPLYVSF